MDLTTVMVEASSCLVCVVDTETGTVSAVNGAMQRLTGLPAEELLDRPVWEVLDFPVGLLHMRQALEGDACTRLPMAFEASVRTTRGEQTAVVWSGSFVAEEAGARRSLVLTGIHGSEETAGGGLLSHLMRAATSTALVGADLDGRITFFSTGAEVMLGYAAAEMIGQTIPPETFESPDFLEAVSGWSARHETRDWNLVRKDGTPLTASVTVSPLTDGNGHQIGFLGIAHDVTDERRRQTLLMHALEQHRLANDRLTALDRSKNAFIQTVNHELRTPLTNIAGYAELLSEGTGGQLTAEQAELVGAIVRNADRLATLMGQLLALAERRTAASDDDAEVLDLRAVVEQVAKQASVPSIGNRKVEVHLPRRPARVRGRHAALHDVVRELVANALKCTDDAQSVRCEVTVDVGWVHLEVSDDGFGIPADDRGDLFKPFFRTSTSLERAIQGAGLGLAQVHRTVVALGGEVTVASAHLGGTVVRVRLPRAVES